MKLRDNLKAPALKMALKTLKMRQYEFAEILHCGGGTVSGWCKGVRIPRNISWEMICIKLAELGITFNEKGGVIVSKRSLEKD